MALTVVLRSRISPFAEICEQREYQRKKRAEERMKRQEGEGGRRQERGQGAERGADTPFHPPSLPCSPHLFPKNAQKLLVLVRTSICILKSPLATAVVTAAMDRTYAK
jgi:hypothetical protein